MKQSLRNKRWEPTVVTSEKIRWEEAIARHRRLTMALVLANTNLFNKQLRT